MTTIDNVWLRVASIYHLVLFVSKVSTCNDETRRGSQLVYYHNENIFEGNKMLCWVFSQFSTFLHFARFA